MKRMATLILFLSGWVWMLNTCSAGEHQGADLRNLRKTSIPDIRMQVNQLEGQLVRTTGTVNYTFYTNFFGGGFYSIVDSSKTELLITTKDRTCPQIGEEVDVVVVPKVILQLNNTLGLVNAEYKRILVRP